MDKEIFDSIVKGANEGLAYLEAKKHSKPLPKGVREHHVVVPGHVDVRAIRQKLKMNQTQFAETFGFIPSTYKKWERGEREPDTSTRAYLKVIAANPAAVMEALRG